MVVCYIYNGFIHFSILCSLLLSSTLCVLQVPVYGDGQQAAHGRHHRGADHTVKDGVHLPDEVVLHHQLSIMEKVNDDGLQGVGHAHQHVGYSQTETRSRHVSSTFDL